MKQFKKLSINFKILSNLKQKMNKEFKSKLRD